jgi:hypothetical protein
MKEFFNKHKVCIIISIVSILIGRFVLIKPKSVEIKEEIKIEKKENKVEDKKKNKKIKIIKKKDKEGNETTETTIEENTDTHTEENKEEKIAIEKSTKIKERGPTLGIMAISTLSKDILTKTPEYAIIGSVPVVGSVSANGLITKDKIGLGVSVEF